MVCDFVCTKVTRKNFDADIVVWMDTIKEEDLRTRINFFKIQKLIFILQNGMIIIIRYSKGDIKKCLTGKDPPFKCWADGNPGMVATKLF